MTLKLLWKNIVSLLIVAILAVVITKFLWPTETEIDERLDEIKRTKALVDSLMLENTRLSAMVDSLSSLGQERKVEIELLKARIDEQKESLQAALEAIHDYQGTDDDLIRELNDLIKSPLPTLPD